MTTKPLHQDWAALLVEAISKPGIIDAGYRFFRQYSIGNQIAAVYQCYARNITPGPIATLKEWNKRNRLVKRYEKGISLLMPIIIKDKETEEEKMIFTWKSNWFVLSQTDGEEYEESFDIPTWNKDLALTRLGITLVDFDYPNGNCFGYASGQNIAVSPLATYPHKTLFHEIAHVVLGHTKEGSIECTTRNLREVEAESVAYILINVLDLTGKEESRGYIQGWLQDNEIDKKTAKRIFKAADTILKSGRDPE